MNAIEKLIRTKLKTKLTEEKRRIAAELIAEAAPKGQVKANKQKSLADKQVTLNKMQAKASASKDPAKTAQAIKIMKDKLALGKSQLSQMR